MANIVGVDLGTYSIKVAEGKAEAIRLRDLTDKYIEAKAETELTLSHVFVLDSAYKAEKKAYPKKSIIVMVATVATFVLAVIAFLFFESFLRKLRATG